MIAFEPITIKDKEWMTGYLKKGHRGSLEYNFTSNFIWRHVYHLERAKVEGFLVVRSGKECPTYVFPSGDGNVKLLVETLLEDARERQDKLRFNTVLNEDRAKLDELFPAKFEFKQLRHAQDYVYSAESLRTLAGKKLSSKRNHINRFEENNPDWGYEEITPGNLGEALAMHREWCKEAGCMDNESLYHESCAVEETFRHFEELELTGGLIRTNGRVVAYTFGEPLSEDTYLVHIEKAFYDIQGAYPIINREFCRANTEGFMYVNREDDTGDEGLRKAKLSYRPEKMIEKVSAQWID